MTDLLLLGSLIGPPVAGAALAMLMRRDVRAASRINAATQPLALVASVTIAARLVGGGSVLLVGTTWRIDALSALLACLISLVASMSAWFGPGLGELANDNARAAARAFRIYANLFAATMLIAVTTNNLGMMWVAVEATTVTSALLIAVHKTRASIDASWKYLLIGSVGIALAFTGTVLGFVDYTSTGGSVSAALNWTTLRAAAPALHPEVARLAFVFLLVGFGTKAGLAPMHTWLPDAHSEAPAPLSAMMSGVLLGVAFYALARWKAIVDAAVGPAFADTLVLVVAVATIAVGSLSLAAQVQYKRLLAYSSIEHIGLSCFGLALGPIGVFAALLHLTGHALAKSTAFLLSGRVLERYRTREIAGTPGLLATLPATGGLFAASVLALVGLPPFGLFLSEILLIRAGWLAGHPAVTAVVLILMLVAFASLIQHLHTMLFGPVPAAVQAGERPTWMLVLLVLPLAGLIWIGVWMPLPLRALITSAAGILRP